MIIDYNLAGEIILKLSLALLLGGLVGFEREYKSRPAGLRTHMLVCLGAALVQITAMDYYYNYHRVYNVDPMRLAAQVISGIGFLGAGTIIKEGANIKGLTTAASVWVVACIGIAVGTGLYLEAVAATIFIFIALKGFKKIEEHIGKGKKSLYMQVVADNVPGKLGQIGSVIGLLGVSITNVEMQNGEDKLVIIDLTLKPGFEISIDKIADKIMSLEGIKEIRFM